MVDPVQTIKFLEASYSSMALNWEAILACQYRFAIARPRTMVDVGAHQGAHVAHFLDMGAERIIAFEPIPELAAQLVQKFGCERLEVHNIALGDHSGQTTFLIDRAAPSESGLRPRSDQPASRDFLSIQVEMKNLDRFNLQTVDYIKLDAEGAELMVLSGAEATLAAQRPLLSIEYGWEGYNSYGLSKRTLLEWAEAHRYVVCDLFGAPLASAAYDTCVDRYYWDYFVVPEEATDLMQRLQQNGRAVLADIEGFHVG
jgi:FkbM family methyltransferase